MSPEKIIKEDFKTQKLSFEYVLPDYEPTVKRVMLSGARLMPNEKIVLGDGVTLSGSVEYRMVYQSVDDELSSLTFSVPYECTLSAEEGALRHLDNVTLSSFSCMPSGPRRVLAKGEICAAVQSVGYEEMTLLGGEEDLFTLCESFPYSAFLYSSDEEREYAETVGELSDTGASVLYSDAALRIDEARPMKDGILVSGKCLISALVSENTKARQLSTEILFEEFLPMGSTLNENSSVRCEASIRSLALDVQADEGVCSLVANARVGFFATVAEPQQISMPLDAYSTSCEIRPVFGQRVLVNERGCCVYKDTLEMKVMPEEADPVPMSDILYASACARIVECTPVKDAVEITLKLALSLVGTDQSATDTAAGEEVAADAQPSSTVGAGYVRERAEETFTLAVPMKGAHPMMKAKASTPGAFCVNAFVEDGVFKVCTEVSFEVSLCEEICVQVCVGAERDESPLEKNEDEVCIVFVDSSDTLWSLAKENHARIDDILKENPGVSCDANSWNSKASLAGVKYVLVP